MSLVDRRVGQKPGAAHLAHELHEELVADARAGHEVVVVHAVREQPIRRAQQIVEAYRQAELQSAFGSECLPPRAAASPDALLPGEIILYPLLLQDRIELLLWRLRQRGVERRS